MGYCIQDIVSRYQKKIGTYDKQQWEKTLEERILYGFTHVPKKKAKLKTELIDVDLVRGSSFTKAKPKHGLLTVTRQALLRLIFLPAYARWWSQQTSLRLFALLLLLYILQLGNMFLFSYATHNLPEDVIENVSGSEVVVPAAMMLFLCILHSEIVSPRTGSKDLSCFTSKSRRYKRVKRRSRVACDYKLPNGAGENSQENSNKFPKRVQLRKASFEASTKRLKRSVMWDTSPAKSRLHQGLEQSSCPDVMRFKRGDEEASGRCLDDDGFESLNSSQNGSGEEIQGEDDQSSRQEPESEVPATSDWAVTNNWKTPRRLSLRLSSEESHDDSSSEGSAKNPDCQKTVLGKRSRSTKGTETRNGEAEDAADIRIAQGPSLLNRRRGSEQKLSVRVPGDSSCNSSDDGYSPGPTALTEGTTSAAEWICFTTNSEDCSVSSDLDDSPPLDHPFASEFQLSPPIIPSPSCAASDKVSCTVWEKGEVKKALMSVLDISSAIIGRVERMPDNLDYFYGGMLVSLLLSLVPSLCRLIKNSPPLSASPVLISPNPMSFVNFFNNFFASYFMPIAESAFGASPWERWIAVISVFERLVLSGFLFFLVAVAERTFKQRFLYAKFFSHLTSFRRARKSELPHFRLNKVRNIKTWLSVRSYLKKRGPQHSVDVIVSSILLITLLLLSFLSVELLKDSERLHCVYNIEALAWCIILGLFLLRFMTLGTKINRKNRNLSVLITEQINLYLQIEQKPNKKDELNVANAVLKLAADLLKELECPYKISGLANPYLYTVTKVVILSALSGVLSEMLGFKLKLDKIKIK